MCWQKHLLGFLNSSLGFRQLCRVFGGVAGVRHMKLAFVLAFALSFGVAGVIPTFLGLVLALSLSFPFAAACSLSRLETWKCR